MDALHSLAERLPIYQLSLISLALLFSVLLFHSIRKPQNLPPTIKGGSLWSGNRKQIARPKPWLLLEEWAKEVGPIFTMWTGKKPTIVISSARIATDLLDKRSGIYSSRPRFIVAGELMTGGDGILFQPYGDRWRNQRRHYHSVLMNKAALEYLPIQEMEAKRLAFDFLNTPENFEKHIERYAASIVTIVSYGRRVDNFNEGFVRSVIERMQAVGLVNLPGKQILDSWPILQDLPEFITPYKKTWRAAREEGTRFWLGLVDEVKKRMTNGTAQNSFTRRLLEMDDHGLTEGEFGLLTGGIFGAGVETTAGTTVAFMLAMTCFPEVQAKAQEELDRVLGDRSPSFADEANLPYIRAMVKETLRWRPVAVLGGTPHATIQDDVYEGYNIPAGSTIMVNLWAVNRDPEYFAEPDRFNPDRYLDPSAPQFPQKIGHSGFGYGRRICPGMHVAEKTVFIALATILYHFKISKYVDPSEGEITPDIFAFTDGFNSRAEPFKCQITPRKSTTSQKIISDNAEALEQLQVYEP